MREMKYFLTIILLVLFMVQGYSQLPGENPEPRTTDYNNISMPPSTSAAAFDKVGNTSVNIATGTPIISIPLYTFEMDGVKVPISLSYDATGVKVGQLATSVGLGWSLVAGGQFSRTVRAKADEFDGILSGDEYGLPISDTVYAEYDPNQPREWVRYMAGTIFNGYNGLAKKHDHMPDEFHYSFLGNSNSFVHDLTGAIVKEKRDGLIIDDWGIEEDFKVKDLNGNTYIFSEQYSEKSNNLNSYITGTDPAYDGYHWEQEDGFIPSTAWKLTTVTTKNNKTIDFQYQSVPMEYTIPRSEATITVGYNCRTPTGLPVKSFTYTNTTYKYNTQLIKKISSPDGNIVVDFSYATDNNITAPGVWLTKLTTIIVTNLMNGKKKEFHFVYDRFGGDSRLRLDELFEMGYGDNNQPVEKPHYKFTYMGSNMPEKTSYAQDFFGYLNNSSGYPSLVPHALLPGLNPEFQQFFDLNSRDRSLNLGGLKNGVLSDIQYPSGGTTHFSYEANQINGNYVGGLRVNEIKDMDPSGIYNRKTYQYFDLVGYDLEHNRPLTMKKSGEDAWEYHSSFVKTPGSVGYSYLPGFFYKKVAIISHNGTEKFKEEHYFEENSYARHRFDYVPTEIKYYKQNDLMPITIKEYLNNLVGTPTTFRWNILGDMMCFTLDNNEQGLGHNILPVKVDYTGNYAYLPTQITSTDFLGTNHKPITTIKYISYDPTTLLKTQEIRNNQTTRTVNSSTGAISYPVTDNKADIITTDYQYPWSSGVNLPSLPASLPISKIVHSNHGGSNPIAGQFFKYDTNGNIKTTFQYNKGEGSNTAGGYIPTVYDEMASFLFANGKPVQTLDKYGSPTTYIWAFNGEKPVAKIEGKLRASINQSKIQAVENATYSGLSSALTALRSDTSVAGAMVTTFTYEPLKGVKTITDPKGDTITYYYDAFGRLIQVRDKQDNILTENEYNYAH